MRLARMGLTVASVVMLASAAAAADKKVVMQGKFGEVRSEQNVKPGYGPELGQKVRVDQLASSDAEWNGSTITVYEHSVSYPDKGTYAIYGVLAVPSGDKAFVEFSGKFDVVTKDGKFAEAPFAAHGKVVGGTGKLEKISGTLRHSGKVTPDEGGRYSIEMNVNY
jgi:hypothetical protein